MRINNIMFPTYLKDIKDIENGNIEVFVEVENGYIYTVVVATAKNIDYLMEKKKMNYFEPGHPFIIVKELTQEIIEETLQAYAEKNDGYFAPDENDGYSYVEGHDGYWLKFYHFAGDIDETVFKKLKAEHIEYRKELDSFLT
jgi:hypothetical protein